MPMNHAARMIFESIVFLTDRGWRRRYLADSASGSDEDFL